MFNIDLMKRGYFEEELFDDGYALFNRKVVKVVEVDKHMLTDHIKVNATVVDGNDTRDVVIEFKDDRKKGYAILVGDRSCTCHNFVTDRKNCEHMAATVLFCNNYEIDELLSGVSGEEAQTSPEIFEYENLFLEDYKFEFTKTEKVELIPIVEVVGREFKIYFKLGVVGKLKYIIRDIHKFEEMFRNKESFEYGKLFKFYHNINNIIKSSQDIVNLTLELIASKTPEKDPKFLTLNISEFINFLELYKNKQITFIKERNEESEFLVTEGTMPFSLGIESEENSYSLFIRQLVKFTMFAPTGILSINDDSLCFYKMTDHKIFELLKILHKKNLSIGENEIFSFYDNVVTELSKYMTVEVDFDIDEMYSEICDFRIDVSASHAKNILVKVFLIKDEVEYKYTPDSIDGLYYSQADSIKIMNLLSYYGDKKDNKFTINDNTRIYEFLSEGIEDLSRVCSDISLHESLYDIQVIDNSKLNVSVAVSNNLLDVDLSMDNITQSEIAAILKSYKDKVSYHRLESGQFVNLDAEFVKDLNNLVTNLGINEDQLVDSTILIPHYKSLYIDHIDTTFSNINVVRDNTFNTIISKVNEIKDLDISVPSELNATLKPYQIDGYKYLKTMEHLHFGAILADDMGLGKTIQVITSILASKDDRPSLIVCPSSLILNWEKEFTKFAPNLNIMPLNEESNIRQEKIKTNITNQVLITSYDLLKRDLELLEKLDFQYFVIDESHYIKNNTTQNFKSVKKINASHKIALTGTPIENSLSELWSLFDFVLPGYLGSYSSFLKNYELPIVRDNDQNILDNLKALVKPFILRRLKSEVLDDLPEKNEQFMFVDMNEEHKKLYQANLLEIRNELESTTARDFNKSRMIVLAMLTRLRQLSCDPRLLYDDYTHGSSKIDLAVELIKESIASGQKTLLFSQFTSMLGLIEERLIEEGIDYYLLKGSTKKTYRHEMTESFNHDKTMVFLISLKAGGTGLNLVGANTVIHFDPWWNMSAQNQATDRVYRIGQKQNVTVYKLLTAGTIEEKIISLQEKKSKLADSMLSQTNQAISKMTKEELLELFE